MRDPLGRHRACRPGEEGALYARERVGHVWLVDPVLRTIEVFRLRGSTYELVGTWGGDDGPFAIEPFEAVAFPPEAFWGRALAPR